MFKLVLLLLFISVRGEFKIPSVTFEVFEPKGLKVSIPDVEGIELFAFHGNINKNIKQIEPGELNEDVTEPEGGRWTYFNKNVRLSKGDKIHYWIYVQHKQLGYKRDNLEWTVGDSPNSEENCLPSQTIISKKTVCQNEIVFQDDFSGFRVDKEKWLIEKYIPTAGPDYEFSYYDSSTEVCRVESGLLLIKPKPAENFQDLTKNLDLREDCTRDSKKECLQKYDSVFPTTPVASGKLVSKISFSFGKVDIRAKLPDGEWIYPQIYLEMISDPKKKLVVAYSRGNRELRGNFGDDIGSNLLFGGPIISSREPNRSQYLKSWQNQTRISSDFHDFTIVWSQNNIKLLVDSLQYGYLDKSTAPSEFFQQNNVRLVIGVGVGGMNDFPDGYRSGPHPKPWRNRERNAVSNFFKAKSDWKETWHGEDAALQVKSVKITAL